MPTVNHSAKLAAAIMTALIGDTALSAIAGSRIYAGRAAQGSALPRIVWHGISTVSDHSHNSATTSDAGIDDSLVQFDCEARTMTGCHALTDALAAVLDGAAIHGGAADLQACFRESGGFSQPMDLDTGDGVTEAHRISTTYRFLWRDN